MDVVVPLFADGAQVPLHYQAPIHPGSPSSCVPLGVHTWMAGLGGDCNLACPIQLSHLLQMELVPAKFEAVSDFYPLWENDAIS